MKIAVYSMARSGHHAVFEWLQRNLDGEAVMVNHENKQVKEGQYGGADLHVLVIRDPYNWLASWLTSAGSWRTAEWMATNTPEWVIRYKGQCREALGETNYLPDAHFLNYNRWFADGRYREELGQQLGLSTFHEGVSTVSSGGGGSTWDGMRLQGRAQEMQVLTRWERMKDHAKYRELIDDPEVQELATKLFSMAPVVFNG